MAKWLTLRSAKPLSAGSNPARISKQTCQSKKKFDFYRLDGIESPVSCQKAGFFLAQRCCFVNIFERCASYVIRSDMRRISLNLPPKYRLDFSLVKRRGVDVENSLVKNLTSIHKIKKGSKISRFFRYIFEGRKIKSFLGVNLTLIAISSSLIPSKNSVLTQGNEENNLTKVPVILETQVSEIRYPVDKVMITQGFKFYHPGVDFDGVTGDPVFTVLDGKIEAIQFSSYGYGNAIYINHEGSYSSLYAHLSKIEVEKNQFVIKGAEIGKMGATGFASGDHLHFEIRENGIQINPLTILP